MSKTLYVEFRGQGFWASDVVSAVFLKYLTDTATPRLGNPNNGWLSDAVANWRVNAMTADLGFFLNDSWSDIQIQTFTELAETACNVLSKRIEIPAEEISSWQMVDGLRVFVRGLPCVTTASVVRLGQAVIQLVNNSLPESPPGTWWFFGTEEAPLTMQKRER